MPPTASGVRFVKATPTETTAVAEADFSPDDAYSAVICDFSPTVPTTAMHRRTPRYLPISRTAVDRTSRGVTSRYINRVTSAISARSRCVSAADDTTGAGTDGSGAETGAAG